MEPKQTADRSAEKRFALLIDADNVSAKYVAVILDELSKYGTTTYKRIYGDWTSTLHSKWKNTLLENSITPIQQFSYTQGKNATDHAMIIDAMDILYTGQVDGFCIASSDSDFTRLAARIRESGLFVVGMGESKTPLAFRKACDIFTTLELLIEEVPTKRGRKHTGHAPEGPAPSIAVERIEEAVDAIITYNQNNGKATGLGEIGSRLQKRYPDFDVRNYGTNQLRKLLERFESVCVMQEGNSIFVNLVDENGSALAKSEQAAPSKETPANAADETAAKAEDGEEPESFSPEKTASKPKRTLRRRRRKQDASQDDSSAKTNAANTENELEKKEKKQDEKPKAPSYDIAQIEAYVTEQLDKAGSAGVSLQVLGKRVRSKFRNFRLHDLGYSKFKDMVNDMTGIDFETRDKATYAKLKE